MRFKGNRGCLLDDVVGVLIEFFGDSIVFVDDEVLVEDFEDFLVLEVIYGC